MNRLVKTAKDEWKKWLRGTTARKETDEDGLYRNANIQYLFNRMSTVTYMLRMCSAVHYWKVLFSAWLLRESPKLQREGRKTNRCRQAQCKQQKMQPYIICLFMGCWTCRHTHSHSLTHTFAASIFCSLTLQLALSRGGTSHS